MDREVDCFLQIVVSINSLHAYWMASFIYNFECCNFNLSWIAGDLVDAVVPFMGESITDGTLAKFLKRM